MFEVLGPSSWRIDRIVKLREYGAVDSIRRYIIVESASFGRTVLEKQDDASWKAHSLTGEDILTIPELEISVPVMEFYEDVVIAE